MGKQITATLDEDLYDKVTDDHTETGKSKSSIVNDRVRDSYEKDKKEKAGDNILPYFGQGLFVAGFVIAMQAFPVGVTMAMLGLALMVGAKTDEYVEKHGVGYWKAFVNVLGA